MIVQVIVQSARVSRTDYLVRYTHADSSSTFLIATRSENCVFIMRWNTASTLCNPNGITTGSKSPMLCYDTHIFLFIFLYLTSCITTAVTWLTPTSLIVSVYLWLFMTHHQYAVVTQYWYLLFLDSLWLSTICWLTMSHVLIVTVTHCPSDTIVLVMFIVPVTPLFSFTIRTDVFDP